MDSIAGRRGSHDAQVIVAGLMTEAPRARMDDDGDLPDFQPERRGVVGAIDLIDAADFEEMISRSERAELFAPARVGLDR